MIWPFTSLDGIATIGTRAVTLPEPWQDALFVIPVGAVEVHGFGLGLRIHRLGHLQHVRTNGALDDGLVTQLVNIHSFQPRDRSLRSRGRMALLLSGKALYDAAQLLIGIDGITIDGGHGRTSYESGQEMGRSVREGRGSAGRPALGIGVDRVVQIRGGYIVDDAGKNPGRREVSVGPVGNDGDSW